MFITNERSKRIPAVWGKNNFRGIIRVAPSDGFFWPSQWGRKLDPEKFWKGRVIWCDISVIRAANLESRGYPPIPAHKPELMDGFPLNSRSQRDIVPSPWDYGLDGGNAPCYHYADAERAYWDWFSRTKPKTPDALEREQLDAARMLVWRKASSFYNGTNLDATIPQTHRIFARVLMSHGILECQLRH